MPVVAPDVCRELPTGGGLTCLKSDAFEHVSCQLLSDRCAPVLEASRSKDRGLDSFSPFLMASSRVFLKEIKVQMREIAHTQLKLPTGRFSEVLRQMKIKSVGPSTVSTRWQ